MSDYPKKFSAGLVKKKYAEGGEVKDEKARRSKWGKDSIPPLTPGIDYGGPLVPGKRFGPDPEIQEEEIKRMFQPRGYKRGGPVKKSK